MGPFSRLLRICYQAGAVAVVAWEGIWLFPKISGPSRSPYKKEHSVLDFLGWPLLVGNSHVGCKPRCNMYGTTLLFLSH